jgi:hypothetical protein
MGYDQILAHLTGPISHKALNTSFKLNGLGLAAPPATSCRCQPPFTTTGRPTPATSGNFSGGLQKKNCIFFFMCFFLSFDFVFQPQCLDTLSLRGDVRIFYILSSRFIVFLIKVYFLP